ncbi:O-antigen ligase domain-containing protein [Mariprofundus sp. EBB-1]|uniref:O-antigen ligase family protein n=1 Tax=Mariprofundus sp. EBB-1 TaxID=2650971 RepID=UPI000EF2689C|nr:O-antigen ligase family protein [Mariprofundus sp. EBB-1]RLL55565.1 O-antigen ligase domain-containing protein [Mariprofundus sp. EBB-1]
MSQSTLTQSLHTSKAIITCWLVFFLSPLFWPNILDSYIAMDLLAFVTALIAAAVMATNQDQNIQTNSTMAWIFFALLIIPICIQLLFMDLRNPWRAWQMALYIASSWLIFRMSGASAAQLIGSANWKILLACIGNFYVVFAVAQQFQLPFTPGFELFPIWQDYPSHYAGVLLQTNMQGLFLILVCTALWSECNKAQRYLPWLIASILPCAGLLATSSRSSSILLVLAVTMLLFISKQKTTLCIKILSTIVIAFCIVSYWHAFPASDIPTLFNRFETTGTQIRLLIWDMSTRLFLEHIWLGIGAGNLISYGTEILIPSLLQHPEWAEIASTQLSGGNLWAHNSLLQFLLEWGIAGGIAIIGLMIMIGKKCWDIYLDQEFNIESGQTQAGLGLILMTTQSMVSVALLQGFFLVLFALYAAALFTKARVHNVKTTPPLSIALLLLPAIFLAYNWQWFTFTLFTAEKNINQSIQTESFIQPMAIAIDSPWSSRAALQWYFLKLQTTNASNNTWIGSENLAFRYWFQHQSSQSLRYRILIAHLKDDIFTEKYLIELHNQAYPTLEVSQKLTNHVTLGHKQGEQIEIW